MKPATPEAKRPKTRNPLFLLFAALGLSACTQPAEAPESVGLEIRIAHLTDLAWKDRNHNGQPTEFMPTEAYQALLGELTSSPADVLVLRGLGSQAALAKLAQDLDGDGGPVYQITYIPGKTVYEGIGFLHQQAVEETRTLTHSHYEVQGVKHTPVAGGIRISTPENGSLWIWNALLPDVDAGYELRRNEARLLSQSLRPLLQADTPLLVSLHSREEPDSPMIRMFPELGLIPLVAEDARGDSWTHRDPEGRVYRKDQLLFVSKNLDPVEIRIEDTPGIRKAGEFRHQRLWIR